MNALIFVLFSFSVYNHVFSQRTWTFSLISFELNRNQTQRLRLFIFIRRKLGRINAEEEGRIFEDIFPFNRVFRSVRLRQKPFRYVCSPSSCVSIEMNHTYVLFLVLYECPSYPNGYLHNIKRKQVACFA